MFTFVPFSATPFGLELTEKYEALAQAETTARRSLDSFRQSQNELRIFSQSPRGKTERGSSTLQNMQETHISAYFALQESQEPLLKAIHEMQVFLDKPGQPIYNERVDRGNWNVLLLLQCNYVCAVRTLRNALETLEHVFAEIKAFQLSGEIGKCYECVAKEFLVSKEWIMQTPTLPYEPEMAENGKKLHEITCLLLGCILALENHGNHCVLFVDDTPDASFQLAVVEVMLQRKGISAAMQDFATFTLNGRNGLELSRGAQSTHVQETK